MPIQWSRNKDSFYGIVLESYDNILAIQEQVHKTLEIAQDKNGWNCVIFDIWIYTECRLICTIQDKSKARKQDSDFNVSLQLNEISSLLREAAPLEYSKTLQHCQRRVINTIKTTFQNEKFLMSFDEFWLKNPFVVRFYIEGVLEKTELQFG